MLTRLEPARIYYFQILTVGLYFFHWCARSGGEVNRALGHRECPRAWWFILPFGGYWWMWQYASALHQLSGGMIKLTDTFAYYIIATFAWLVVPGFNFSGFNNSFSAWFIVNALVAILILILGHGFCLAQIQNKLNQVDGYVAASLPKQR